MTVRRVMPSRTLSVTGGVIAVPLPHDEDVRGRGLGDVAVLVQHDRLVEAGALGVGLRERRVDVGAGDLAARRDHRVVDAAPGGDRRVQALVVLDVLAVGQRDDRDLAASGCGAARRSTRRRRTRAAGRSSPRDTARARSSSTSASVSVSGVYGSVMSSSRADSRKRSKWSRGRKTKSSASSAFQ